MGLSDCITVTQDILRCCRYMFVDAGCTCTRHKRTSTHRTQQTRWCII